MSDQAQIADYRLSLCARCPEQVVTMGARRCRLCGCFLNLKARMMSESCPAGHWPAVGRGFFSQLFGGQG